MQNKILYIIAGANGSGKSTLASELLPSENLRFLNAAEVAKEICPENIESVKIKAGKIVLERLEKFILILIVRFYVKTELKSEY